MFNDKEKVFLALIFLGGGVGASSGDLISTWVRDDRLATKHDLQLCREFIQRELDKKDETINRLAGRVDDLYGVTPGHEH